MHRNKKMLKRPLLRKGPKLTPEQQEILDSGLAMLAHMIVETHLKRKALDPEYYTKLRKRCSTETQ